MGGRDAQPQAPALSLPCLRSRDKRLSSKGELAVLLAEEDVVAHWSADGRSVMAYRRAEIPCRVERVDLATGQRSLFKELAPADRAGLLSMREVFITDDPRSYAYTTYYQVSSPFVSEGTQ